MALVATSYDLVAQTVGNSVASYNKERVMSLDLGDGSVGSGGDTCGLRLSGEL